MKYIDMNPKVYNVLGRSGENEAYTARFPQNGWPEEYGGSGQFYLVVKRADGTVYPAVITEGNGYVYWQIETADVAYAGIGECEYQYRVNDVVVKSVQYKTRVLVSLSGGETPAPEQPWVEQVLQAGSEATESAQAAEASAIRAETAETSAEGYASSAESFANAAETFKTDAETAKDNAVQAKNAAISAKEEAQTAAGSAGSFAQSASDSATDAGESAAEAQTAQAAAETAKAGAETAKTAAEAAQAAAEAAAATLVVDDELSEDSENPVQNKVINAALTQQSQQIAALQTTKADKAVEDARYKKQQTEIQFLLDAAKGQIAEVVTDDDEAYSKAVPSYTGGSARFADIKKLGGKIVVWNQMIQRIDNNVSSGISFSYDSATNLFTVDDTNATGANANSYPFHDAILTKGHVYMTISDANTDGINVSYWSGTAGYPKIGLNSIFVVSTDPTATMSIAFRVLGNHTPFGSVSFHVYLCDLTKMFGINTAEAVTDAMKSAIEAYLTEHPEYNAGEVISADCDKVVSEGFNLIDPNSVVLGIVRSDTGAVPSRTDFYSSDYIEVIGGRDYYFKIYRQNSSIYGCAWYDANKTFISGNNYSSSGVVGVLTAPINAKYMRTLIGDATLLSIACVNFSQLDTTKTPHNGQYMPYMAPAQLNIPAGLREDYPLRSAGNTYDAYEFIEKKYVNRVGTDKIKNLQIIRAQVDGHIRFKLDGLSKQLKPSGNILCDSYLTSNYHSPSFYGDKLIATSGIDTANVFIWDDAFDSVDALKNAVGESIIFYEISIEEDIDISSYFPEDFAVYLPVEDGGSLTFHQTSTEFPIPNEEDIYYTLEASA